MYHSCWAGIVADNLQKRDRAAMAGLVPNGKSRIWEVRHFDLCTPSIWKGTLEYLDQEFIRQRQK